MIYKVVFKKAETTGIRITETKFKDISRVCTDKGNGVTFFDVEGEVLTFIPNESLLYIEKVKPLVTDHVAPTTTAALFGIDVNRGWFEQAVKEMKEAMGKEVFAYSRKFPGKQEGRES